MFTCVRCGGKYGDRVPFCHLCGGFGTVLVAAERPADSLWRGSPEVESAAVLVGRSFNSLSSSAYPSFKFGSKSLCVVYGRPGAGKTTFVMKLLDGMSGNVLLLSLEEALGDTVVSKLRWLEIVSESFKVAYVRSLDEIEAVFGAVSPIAVAIDSLSISTLSVDDLRRMANEYGVPVFATVHVTKENDPAGSMRTVHEADIVIAVDGGKWNIEKSRYGVNVGGDI